MSTNESTPRPNEQNQFTCIPGSKSNLKQKKFKKQVFFVMSATVILLLLYLRGYFLHQNIKKQNQSSSASSIQVSDNQTKTLDQKTIIEISYIPRERILSTVKLQSESEIEAASSSQDWENDIYNFYKVGAVNFGKYKGGDLLLVLFSRGGPCKGSNCDFPTHLRYIRKNNTVTLLTRISGQLGAAYRKINPFKKFGLSLAVDDDFTIPNFEYIKKIEGINSRQILKINFAYIFEKDGELIPPAFNKVFTHSIYGDSYTTNYDGSDFAPNHFFAFRPDGTYLQFGYYPDISAKNISWADNKKNASDYVSTITLTCGSVEPDENNVVNPLLVKNSDLIVAGKENNTGDLIYELKDQNNTLYAEFFATYEEHYADGPDEGGKPKKTFSEFISSRPFFFWRDPFGRLIRFNNTEFIPPLMCEPIIYLYPETTQKILITLGENINVLDSMPKYKNGWSVIAEPSGKILNLSDSRTHPYLFWEGWSLIFPIQREGFVVEQNEIANFLEKNLPKLGLSDREYKDFINAWLPYFSDSPYYFLTFLNQDMIDKIAPLQISPKPDTIIRVMMDIEPLEKPILVEKQKFDKIPKREGFTVIEWGGLSR